MNEYQMYFEITKWVRLHQNQYPCLEVFHHVCNEGRRAPQVARQIGILKGLPDYHMSAKAGPYCGFYMEVKVWKKTPSETQLIMMDKLTRYGNYCCWVDNLDDAFREIEEYCRLKG